MRGEVGVFGINLKKIIRLREEVEVSIARPYPLWEPKTVFSYQEDWEKCKKKCKMQKRLFCQQDSHS